MGIASFVLAVVAGVIFVIVAIGVLTAASEAIDWIAAIVMMAVGIALPLVVGIYVFGGA